VAASKTFVTQSRRSYPGRGDRPSPGLDGRGPRSGPSVPALRKLPRRHAALALNAPTSSDLARKDVNSRGFMFVGRGSSYPAALEGALKLKESQLRPRRGLRRRRAEARPDLAAGRGMPARGRRDTIVGLRQAHQQRHGGRARDARVIAVATEGDPAIERLRRRRVLGARHARGDRAVLAIIPLQLFAYHVAIARGTDVDQPRNLASPSLSSRRSWRVGGPLRDCHRGRLGALRGPRRRHPEPSIRDGAPRRHPPRF
jgi:hypothetical protein